MPIPAPSPIACGSRITSILRRRSYGSQSRRGLNRVHFENRGSMPARNQETRPYTAPQVRTAGLRFPNWTRFKSRLPGIKATAIAERLLACPKDYDSFHLDVNRLVFIRIILLL